ncbi:MAG: ATP-binding protein [Paludibacteraceae bacterium]|nr:ATP-binding protein [Paludibacteraceae bacterium]
MYNRDLQQTLLELSNTWSIISVTGPRQSGKTTLCKNTFPQYQYVNLEHIPTRDNVLHDIDGFLDKYPDGLIIDEAQYVPEIFSYLQVRVDENKHLRYIISGSSDFLMMKGISQSLAGRVAVKRLLPLSIHELGSDANCLTDELIFNGFFPAIWGDKRNPKEVYESYYETYLDRDVREIMNVQNISDFRHFIVLCAGRVGSEFNAVSLCNDIGVSNQTISNWMTLLETSYTAFRFYPYFKNIGKRLSKTPKIYFYDVGLACWLLGIRNMDDLKTHPLRGALFENMVVVEMLKQKYHNGNLPNLYFYRDKSQHEVDVIEENGTSLFGYEIKSGKTFHPDWNKNLTYLSRIFGDSLVSTKIVYDGELENNTEINGLINFRNLK